MRECGLDGELELTVEESALVIRPTGNVREGWAEAAQTCVVVSPNELLFLKTAIIAPMRSNVRRLPFCVVTRFGGRQASIALDQVRTVDKSRLVKPLGTIDKKSQRAVLAVLREMVS